MRFDCGETHEEKKARLREWHRWFAWYPIEITEHDCRWLEWVMRKGEYSWSDCWWVWFYKTPTKE